MTEQPRTRIAVILDGPHVGQVATVAPEVPVWDFISPGPPALITTYRLRDMPLATGRTIAVGWSGPDEHPPADWLLRSIALILKPSAIPVLDRARRRLTER